MEEEENCEVLM